METIPQPGTAALDRVSRRDIYLTRILSLIQDNERSAKVWRDHVDPWFAYSMGGGFLVRTGNFHTFDAIRSQDRNRIRRLLPALNRMHWMSSDAKERLDGLAEGIVIKDHTYPVWALRDRALAERPRDIASMDRFLTLWYRVAVLTREQHRDVSGEREREYVSRMSNRQSADLSKYDLLNGARPYS